MQAIDAYLQGPPPGYALLIAGDWGVGKSFLWTRYAEGLKHPSSITFSAAGLQTHEDLERALFQASIKGIGPEAFVEAGAVIGRALLRFAKIDPKDITLKADVSSGNTVVCIDDIERFAGDFAVLFGLVVNLIDEHRLHCVLIADETRAAEKFRDYGKYKERIIGKTVRQLPDAKQFCEMTIRGFGSQRSRDELLAGLERIHGLIEAVDVRNLRTVRFLLTELDGIIRNLPADASGAVATSPLLTAVVFWATATAQKAENISLVSKAFSHENLGMALAFHNAAVQRGRAEDDTDIAKLSELISALGLSEEAQSWPRSDAFIAAMTGVGDVSYLEIATDFRLMQLQDNSPPDPLAVLNDFQRYSDTEVQDAIVAAQAAFSAVGPVKLTHHFGAFRALYYLAKVGIFDVDPAAFAQESLERFNALLRAPENVQGEEFDVWPDTYDEKEKEVLVVCKSINKATSALAALNKRRASIETLITGIGDVPEVCDRPVFIDDIDPFDVLDRIRDHGIRSVIRFQGFFRGRLRIGNSADFVGDDRDFAERLANAIDGKVPLARPMTIVDSELRSLAGSLRAFVRYVDEYREATRPVQ